MQGERHLPYCIFLYICTLGTFNKLSALWILLDRSTLFCGLKWHLHNYHSGLLIFHVVVEPQNSGKSTKSPQNPQKQKYSKNHNIWNLFWLLGLFNCRKHANLIILKLCQCNEQTTSQLLPGKDYVVNNWALDVYNQLLFQQQCAWQMSQWQSF